MTLVKSGVLKTQYSLLTRTKKNTGWERKVLLLLQIFLLLFYHCRLRLLCVFCERLLISSYFVFIFLVYVWHECG